MLTTNTALPVNCGQRHQTLPAKTRTSRTCYGKPALICKVAWKQEHSTALPDNDPIDNPDFDQVVLDDEYYTDMGMTRQEADDEATYKAADIDPLGEDMDLESLFKLRKGLPQHMMRDLEKAEEKNWGPDAVLMAGFRAEEIAMARAIMDAAGAHSIKVIPCTQHTLYMPAELAVREPEPDWENPRDPGFYGGGWGAQRTIVFSGLSLKVQATLIELLEDNGLPPICATMLTQDTARDVVGELMAAAVKEQRGRSNISMDRWEDHEMEGDELEPVEKVLAEQTKERLKELADNLEDEDFDDLFDEDGGDEVTLSVEDVKAARAWRKQQLQQQLQEQHAEALPPQPAQAVDSAHGRAETQQVLGFKDGRTDKRTGSVSRDGLVVEAEYSESSQASRLHSDSNGNKDPVSDPTMASSEATGSDKGVQDLTGLFRAASGVSPASAHASTQANNAAAASTAAVRGPSKAAPSPQQFAQFRDASVRIAGDKNAGGDGHARATALGGITAPSTNGLATDSARVVDKEDAVGGVHHGDGEQAGRAALLQQQEIKRPFVSEHDSDDDLDEGDDMEFGEEGDWDAAEDEEINAALQAEENLLDNIANGKPMTLQELVRNLGDMGQVARRQAGIVDDDDTWREVYPPASQPQGDAASDVVDDIMPGAGASGERLGAASLGGSQAAAAVDGAGSSNAAPQVADTISVAAAVSSSPVPRAEAAGADNLPHAKDQQGGADTWDGETEAHVPVFSGPSSNDAAAPSITGSPVTSSSTPAVIAGNGAVASSVNSPAASPSNGATSTSSTEMMSAGLRGNNGNGNGTDAVPNADTAVGLGQPNPVGEHSSPSQEHAGARAGGTRTVNSQADALDTGFRTAHRSSGPTEEFESLLSPLEAFREACCKAFDAGLPYDVLVAAVDEAERGGSPVLRYRPWHSDGSHVDYATPSPEQPQEGDSAATVMTQAQLRDVAERNGLNFERLLADARAKGVIIREE